MKIEYIREFIVLANTKNYGTASEQLFISQPTLTRHIKEMEEELGVPLFDRSTRKVQPTEYGLFFLPYAKRIAAAESDYLFGLSELKKELMHTLSIGTIHQMSDDVAELVADFCGQYPEYRISSCTGESEELRGELKKGNLDFIFIREREVSEDGFARIPFFSTPLRVILSKKHPLASHSKLHIEELKDESFLMPEETSLASRMVAELAAEHHFKPDIVFRGSKSQILKLVHRNIGISLLLTDLRNAPYDDITSAVLLPQSEASINCLYSVGEARKEKNLKFVEFLRDTLNKAE